MTKNVPHELTFKSETENTRNHRHCGKCWRNERQELAGGSVGPLAVLGSYYHWKFLLPVLPLKSVLLPLKRELGFSPVATIEPFTIAHHRVSMNQYLYSLSSFSADKLGNEYFLCLQSHSPSCYNEFLRPFSSGKSGPGLLEDHMGTFFLDQCWGQCPGNWCMGEFSILFKCIWGFMKLFLYSRDYIMTKFLIIGLPYVSIVHILPIKFTGLLGKEVEGRETEALNVGFRNVWQTLTNIPSGFKFQRSSLEKAFRDARVDPQNQALSHLFAFIHIFKTRESSLSTQLIYFPSLWITFLRPPASQSACGLTKMQVPRPN